MEDAPKPAARLNPVFDIDGRAHVMATQFATTVPASELKIKVASLGEHDLVVGNALNMLISGF
jgi:toxin CcdB